MYKDGGWVVIFLKKIITHLDLYTYKSREEKGEEVERLIVPNRRLVGTQINLGHSDREGSQCKKKILCGTLAGPTTLFLCFCFYC